MACFATLALAASLVSTPAVHAAPARTAVDPCPQYHRCLTLEIEADGIKDATSVLPEKVRRAVAKQMAFHGFKIVDAPRGEQPHLHVWVREGANNITSYAYTMTLTHAGEKTDTWPDAQHYALTIDEFVAKLVDTTSHVANKLREHEHKPPPQEASPTPVGPVGDPPQVSPATRPNGQIAIDRPLDVSLKTVPAPRLNAKQTAGIGLMVAGAIGGGVGTALIARKPGTSDPNQTWTSRSTRTPGIATLAVGAAALVTGVALYVLGRKQASRLQITPVTSHSYGLAVQGSF